MFMKRESADNQNGSTESTWPGVLRITGEEFQQSFAVAQLAVKLWENKMAKLTASPLEKDKVRADGPNEFLKEAWQLIESAHKVVLRPQTDVEYLTSQGGSSEASERVIGRRLRKSCVPFKKLCDPERNKGDSETIKIPGADGEIAVDSKVYRSERGFDELFSGYWTDFGANWRNPGKAKEQGKLRLGKNSSVQMYTKEEREQMAALASDEDKWKTCGQQLLDSWKKGGVSPADFLALAKFRRRRDNRAANLTKKPKRRHKRLMAKARA
jgi:hypothetical protein